MRRRGLAGALALIVVLAGPGAGSGHAAVRQAGSSFLAADLSQVGVVNLAYLTTPGAQVQFAEWRGDHVEPLGSAVAAANGFAVLLKATRWRCDRQMRSFAAVAKEADGQVSSGTFTARTPSCRERLAVTVTRVGGTGHRLRVRLRDAWRIGGFALRVCLAARGAALRCHVVTLAQGPGTTVREFALASGGPWRTELRIGGRTVRSLTGDKGSRATPDLRPLVLATGDSTIQGVDGFLADRLRRVARVRSDSWPGTGLSRSTPDFDWRRLARKQVSDLEPWVTVVSVGINEGYAMKTPKGETVACCSAAWVAEYARRVRAMMVTYARAGAARTLWLDLPVPRNPGLANVVAAVDTAISLAAGGLDAVRVIGLQELLSPGGRYRESIRHNGRTVRVRQPDGIHLSPAARRSPPTPRSRPFAPPRRRPRPASRRRSGGSAFGVYFASTIYAR